MPNVEVGAAHVTVYPTMEKGYGESLGNELQSGFSAKTVAMGNLMYDALKTGIDATVGFVKDSFQQAFSNTAQYEQLIGGVETMFKGSAGIVEQYASEAYKSSGLSANQYMDTVTSFSASMISSLGGDTKKAAEMSNMAITDMSDNANKMGSDMGSIQNAYQGFAKQNYTMLDNLKLGYGGTKEEMQRLLDDAGKISGQKFDLSSYSDIVEAIHVVQTEMGITGTTASEAATTIEGSTNQMKAAWQNWLTGLGTGADMTQLTAQLAESISTALANVLPAVGNIAGSIVTLIAQAFGASDSQIESAFAGIQSAFDAVSQWFSTNIAPVFQAAWSAIQGIVAQAAAAFEEAWPAISEAVNAIGQVIAAIMPVVSAIFQTAGAIIGTVISNAISVIGAVAPVVTNVANAILPAVQAIVGFITGNVLPIVQEVFTTVNNVVTGIYTAIAGAANIVTSIISGLVALITGDTAKAKAAFSGVATIVQSMKAKIVSTINGLKSSVTTVFNAIKNAITKPIESAKTTVKGIIDKIKGFFKFNVSLPHIKLPHFAITPAGWKIGDLLKGSIPKLGIEWYAKGGIADGATLIGAGERGPEAIMPLTGRYMAPFADAVADRIGNGGVTINMAYNAGEDAKTIVMDIARLMKMQGLAGAY